MLGTFNFCTECSLQHNCCCEFENIDSPIVSSNEYKIIVNKLVSKRNHFTLIDNNCFTINTQGGKCPFYINNKCEIYEIRPNDCRLFPYDIKKIERNFYLIRYNLDCNYKDESEDIDLIIEQIKPYIDTFVDEKYNSKLKSKKYKILKQIDI